MTLDYDDPNLGKSFYVGSCHTTLDHSVVIGWTAPSAGLLFEGRGSTWHDPDPRSLIARRTMCHERDVIVDFDDAVEPGTDPADAFPRRPRPPELPPPPASPAPADTTEPVPSTRRAGTAPRGEPPPPAAPPTPSRPAADDLRARDLVMEAIAKPRSDRLRSVLRTLQPDQHRLVTWPSTEHLAVQGHPGTGKMNRPGFVGGS